MVKWLKMILINRIQIGDNNTVMACEKCKAESPLNITNAVLDHVGIMTQNNEWETLKFIGIVFQK